MQQFKHPQSQVTYKEPLIFLYEIKIYVFLLLKHLNWKSWIFRTETETELKHNDTLLTICNIFFVLFYIFIFKFQIFKVPALLSSTVHTLGMSATKFKLIQLQTKTIFCVFFIRVKLRRGDVSQPHLQCCLHLLMDVIDIVNQRLSFHFSCSIFFFLQIVLVTSSCGAGRKVIRNFGGGRVWGISVEDPCFPLCYSHSDLSGIKETHNCTPYAKWGVGSLKASSGGIFYSILVLTAGGVNTSIIVHGLYTC